MATFTAGTVTAEQRRKTAEWDVVTFSQSGGSQIHLSGVSADDALDVVQLVNELGRVLPGMAVERAAQLVCCGYKGQPDPVVKALTKARALLESVACQPSDKLPEVLRASLRDCALDAASALRFTL